MEARTLKALKEADLCLWLIDGANFGGAEHRKAAEIVKNAKGPPLLAAVNKCDLLSPKESQRLTRQIAEEVAPDYCAAVSVKTGRGLEELKKALIALLPPGPPLYDQDWLTDQSLRELAVEFVREAVFKYSRQEIPYQTAVTVEKFTEPEPEDPNPIYRLWATVHVEKEAQKKILVGQGGSTIKKIGTEARLNMEEILEAKLFLNLFVKVSPSWSSNPRLLAEFGYKD
jgi:GTP-binding protein Era